MRFFDIDSQGLMGVSGKFFSNTGELRRMGIELSMIREKLDGMTGMEDVCNAIAMEIENVRQSADKVEFYGYMTRNIAGSYEETEQGLIQIAENMNG